MIEVPVDLFPVGQVLDNPPSVSASDYYDNMAKGKPPGPNPGTQSEHPTDKHRLKRMITLTNRQLVRNLTLIPRLNHGYLMMAPTSQAGISDGRQCPAGALTSQGAALQKQTAGYAVKTGAACNRRKVSTLSETGNDNARAVTLGGALAVSLLGAAGIRRKCEAN